ncbi:MAG: HlyD family efflux transporter periplasmic adaptor subunit [Myxococcota bacterium]|nr:HlyD family efflux transporter periplasmic adaptor subunit [Myxococcota bacterium]
MTSHATPLDTPAEAIPRRKSGLARLLPVLGVAALALLAYAGFRLWDKTRPYEWSGTIEVRTIAVGSRVGGRVKAVFAREGESVQPGQSLVELEPGDLQAQRSIAKGVLEEAAANLEKLKHGARPEEIQQAKARAQTAGAALEESRVGARSEQIAAATARLVGAQVAMDKAQLDASRAHKLFSTQSISQAQLDDAISGYEGAVAQRDASARALEELKNGSRREDIMQAQARALEARASAKLVEAGSRAEDIAAAQGVVESARGRLDQIDVMIGELLIRVPRRARVESLDLRPGDILAPNATAASLVEDDQLYVRIYVPETQIGHVHPAQEVPISVDSFPDRTFKGVVEHINDVGEYSPRNLQTADERANQVFAARIGIREGGSDLRAGMAALIHVPK